MRSETHTAIGIARLAVALADARQGADDIQSKRGIDIVTAADLAVEDLIRTKLADAFPDHRIVGEERGGVVENGSPYWLVDPICGTRCYAANLPLYCTNMALVENDIVTAAVVGIGRSDEIVYAERGSGAWLLTSERAASQARVSDKSRSLWIGGGHSAYGKHRASGGAHERLERLAVSLDAVVRLSRDGPRRRAIAVL